MWGCREVARQVGREKFLKEPIGQLEGVPYCPWSQRLGPAPLKNCAVCERIGGRGSCSTSFPGAQSPLPLVNGSSLPGSWKANPGRGQGVSVPFPGRSLYPSLCSTHVPPAGLAWGPKDWQRNLCLFLLPPAKNPGPQLLCCRRFPQLWGKAGPTQMAPFQVAWVSKSDTVTNQLCDLGKSLILSGHRPSFPEYTREEEGDLWAPPSYPTTYGFSSPGQEARAKTGQAPWSWPGNIWGPWFSSLSTRVRQEDFKRFMKNEITVSWFWCKIFWNPHMWGFETGHEICMFRTKYT